MNEYWQRKTALIGLILSVCVLGGYAIFSISGRYSTTARPVGADSATLCLPADCTTDEDGMITACASRVCADGWIER